MGHEFKSIAAKERLGNAIRRSGYYDPRKPIGSVRRTDQPPGILVYGQPGQRTHLQRAGWPLA
jgi:hypothetical protein